jgi:hypothetical protein
MVTRTHPQRLDADLSRPETLHPPPHNDSVSGCQGNRCLPWEQKQSWLREGEWTGTSPNNMGQLKGDTATSKVSPLTTIPPTRLPLPHLGPLLLGGLPISQQVGFWLQLLLLLWHLIHLLQR